MSFRDKTTASYLCIALFLLTIFLNACGGGGSVSSSGPPPQTPPTITAVTVAPAVVSVGSGKTQQFSVTVSGTGNFSHDVQWSVNGTIGGGAAQGTISATGLYQAPANLTAQTTFTVSSTSTQDTTKSGSASATVAAAASNSGSITITGITPASGSVGDTITITYDDPQVNGTPNAYFTGAAGPILAGGIWNGAGSITVPVPPGSMSGGVWLSAMQQGSSSTTVTSNQVSFTRLPNIIINSERNGLSYGESLQMQYALLGASTPNAVSWSADLGTITNAGLYTAPSGGSETFAKVTACLTGTSSCDATLIEINPVRITPEAPVALSGKSVQLAAERGGVPLSANWSVASGGGSIDANGLYTAPTALTGTGGVIVNASSNTNNFQLSQTVAVTGQVPGLVNRIQKLTNYTDPNSSATGPIPSRNASGVTAVGNRAYVIATQGVPNSTLVAETFIITYDITDPTSPKWMGALELPVPVIYLRHYGNWLFAEGSGNIEVFDISSGSPIFHGFYNFYKDVSIGTQSLPFVNGIFYGLPNSGLTNHSPITVDLIDLRTGTLNKRSFSVNDASTTSAMTVQALTGDGDSKFAFTINNSDGVYTQVYDISSGTPTLTSSLKGYMALGLYRDVLFTYWGIYDVRTATPVLLHSVDLLYIYSIDGNSVLARAGQSGLEVYDVTTPGSVANPVSLLSPGFAALSGNHIFTTKDRRGLGVIDISAPGGLHAVHTNYLDGTPILVFAQAVQGTYFFDGGAWPNEKVTGGFDIRDLTQPAPTAIATLQEPYQINAIQVLGNYAYLGELGQLSIINVANKTSPANVGSMPIAVSCMAMGVDPFLYVATEDGHLLTLDIGATAQGSPTNPKQVLSLTLPDTAQSIRLYQGKLYVADQSGGLLIYALNNGMPQLIKSYTQSYLIPANDVGFDGSLVFVASGTNGVVLLQDAGGSQLNLMSVTALNSRDGIPSSFTYAASLLISNKIAYVGTLNSACTVEGFDYSRPAVLRPVYMGSHGTETGLPDNPTVSTSLLAYGNSIFETCGFASYSVGWMQFDATQPRNVQGLFEDPPALKYYTPTASRVLSAKPKAFKRQRAGGRTWEGVPVTSRVRTH